MTAHCQLDDKETGSNRDKKMNAIETRLETLKHLLCREEENDNDKRYIEDLKDSIKYVEKQLKKYRELNG